MGVGAFFHFNLSWNIVSSLSMLDSHSFSAFCFFSWDTQSSESFLAAAPLIYFSSSLKLSGVSLTLVKLFILSLLLFSKSLFFLRAPSNSNFSSAEAKEILIHAGVLCPSLIILIGTFLPLLSPRSSMRSVSIFSLFSSSDFFLQASLSWGFNLKFFSSIAKALAALASFRSAISLASVFLITATSVWMDSTLVILTS